MTGAPVVTACGSITSSSTSWKTRLSDKDELKGMMEYNPRASDIDCPVCGARMTTFNYRAYNLPIDTCKEEHGYWLDKGEDQKVIDTMKQRIKDLDRKNKAEAQWYSFLSKLGRKKKGLFG